MNERQILAAVSRWARYNGWVNTGRGWVDSHDTIVVRDAPDEGLLRVWRRKPDGQWDFRSTDYPVDSVRECVDFLCVLGILPPELSSLYQPAVEPLLAQIDELTNRLAHADGSAQRSAFTSAMEFLR